MEISQKNLFFQEKVLEGYATFKKYENDPNFLSYYKIAQEATQKLAWLNERKHSLADYKQNGEPSKNKIKVIQYQEELIDIVSEEHRELINSLKSTPSEEWKKVADIRDFNNFKF